MTTFVGSIQQVTLTQSAWIAANPVLLIGQVAFSSDQLHAGTDQMKYKVGNGVDAWTNLDYYPAGGSTSSLPASSITFDPSACSYLEGTNAQTALVETDSFINTLVNADATVQAFSIQRANHTGTQLLSTISDVVYSSEAALSGAVTLTWTGTTAPSGVTNHRLIKFEIGNLVIAFIKLNYGTAGSALTNVRIDNLFGSGAGLLPTPAVYNGWSGASISQFKQFCFVSTTQLFTTGATTVCFISRNAANTAFEIKNQAFTSGAYRYGELSFMYIKA